MPWNRSAERLARSPRHGRAYCTVRLGPGEADGGRPHAPATARCRSRRLVVVTGPGTDRSLEDAVALPTARRGVRRHVRPRRRSTPASSDVASLCDRSWRRRGTPTTPASSTTWPPTWSAALVPLAEFARHPSSASGPRRGRQRSEQHVTGVDEVASPDRRVRIVWSCRPDLESVTTSPWTNADRTGVFANSSTNTTIVGNTASGSAEAGFARWRLTQRRTPRSPATRHPAPCSGCSCATPKVARSRPIASTTTVSAWWSSPTHPGRRATSTSPTTTSTTTPSSATTEPPGRPASASFSSARHDVTISNNNIRAQPAGRSGGHHRRA